MATTLELNIVKNGNKNSPYSLKEIKAHGETLKEFLSHPRIRLKGFELHTKLTSPNHPNIEEILYECPVEGNHATTAINLLLALKTHQALSPSLKISFQGMHEKDSLQWLGVTPKKALHPEDPSMG